MKTRIASVLAALLMISALGVATHAAEPPSAGGVPGPVYVDSTEILYLESYPVQVQLLVRGSLPTPCHELAYDVQDHGDSIDVRLWSTIDLGQMCVQVLEPFELSIPLGSYETADLPVFLNGEEVGRIEIGSGQDEPALLGSGWSYGFCGGYCMADLAIEEDALTLEGRGRADDKPLYVNHGSLTASGQAQLDAALAELAGVPLEPVYGCPDCADGGAAHLELAREGSVERVEMEFGGPPPELADLYELSASLMAALETCTPNELADVAETCRQYQAG